MPDRDGMGMTGRRVYVGEYQLLYKYLRDRFADRLVLTFGEIEDLLGFPLPEAARVEREWWDGQASADKTGQSAAWALADRTATVNLKARNVVFERLMSRDL